MAMYIFEDQYMKQVIPDYNYSPKTFPSFLSDIPRGWRVFCLTCSYFVTIPLFIIAISYFSQSNSKYLSLNPFGLVNIKDAWKNVEQKEESYIGYTKEISPSNELVLFLRFMGNNFYISMHRCMLSMLSMLFTLFMLFKEHIDNS